MARGKGALRRERKFWRKQNFAPQEGSQRDVDALRNEDQTHKNPP